MAVVDILGVPAPKKRREKKGYLRGWEHRKEAEERVLRELEPYEIALWQRIGKQFRGGSDARLKAFRQYVHDHPGEIYGELQSRADRGVEATVKLNQDLGGVEVPCAPPWRYRTRELCTRFGGGKKKR